MHQLTRMVNGLQERLSSISGQLHTRTTELQGTSDELAEQREYFRVQRTETEEARNEVCESSYARVEDSISLE